MEFYAHFLSRGLLLASGAGLLTLSLMGKGMIRMYRLVKTGSVLKSVNSGQLGNLYKGGFDR